MSGLGDKALIKSMGYKPRNLVTGSVEVVGRQVEWTEACNKTKTCLHARTSNATHEAIETYWKETS